MQGTGREGQEGGADAGGRGDEGASGAGRRGGRRTERAEAGRQARQGRRRGVEGWREAAPTGQRRGGAEARRQVGGEEMDGCVETGRGRGDR